MENVSEEIYPNNMKLKIGILIGGILIAIVATIFVNKNTKIGAELRDSEYKKNSLISTT